MSKKTRLFLDQIIDTDIAQSLRMDDFDVQCTVNVDVKSLMIQEKNRQLLLHVDRT